MSLQNQISNTTIYNRYPEIFSELKTIIKKNPKILSFGCSFGLETNTLADNYFTESKIDGYDICKNIIDSNKNKNKNNNISYYHIFENLIKYDLVLCMSVLCQWPESHGEYSFDLFSKTLEDIDKLVEMDGYICIYNSKYLFIDTEISKNYKIIETKHKETGFVYKYSKDLSTRVMNYHHYLFQKIK
jgi:hypothetical protein